MSLSLLRITRYITWRSLMTRRLRTLLSTFGIVLGVAGMLAIGATNQNAMRSIVNLFQNTSGKANLEIHSSDEADSFTENALQIVKSMPGVSIAAPVMTMQAALLEKEVHKGGFAISLFGASTSSLMLYGVDPVLDPSLRDYHLASGRFLSRDPSAYEVVLVDEYAADHKIKAGDRIAVQTTIGQARLKVVGLITKEGPGQLNLGSIGIVSLRTAQRLKDRMNQVDQIDLVTGVEVSNPEILENLRLALQQRLGKGYAVLFPANQGERMAQMLSGYQIGLNFMGAIALFVGAFLIYNAFSMTVVERTHEFGLLRAIGLTRGQVIGQVLIEGVLLGLVGSGLGTALGILLSRGLVGLMSTVLGQALDPGKIPLDVVASSVTIGLIVTVLAAVLPAVQAGRISPLEALRQRGKSQGDWLMRYGLPTGLALLLVSSALLVWNPFAYDVQYRLGSIVVFTLFIGAMLLIPVTTNWWERIARIPFRLIYGSGGQIGARNLERSRLRTMLTAAALLVGVAMIVIIQGMTASFSGDLKSWMEAYIGGDLYVNSSFPLRHEMQERFEAVSGVLAAAPIRYFDVTWKTPGGTDEKINFMAVDPLAYTRVTRFVFSDASTDVEQAIQQLSRGGTIFISSVIAEKYGMKVGDTFNLQTRAGIKPFQVVSVVMDFYNQGMVITGSWEDMRKYFRIDDATTFFIKLQGGATVDGVTDRIDELYGKRYQLSLESNYSIKQRALALMDQAFSMFDILGIIAVVVASLGVVNTLTMSVIERTREIGMLRSIGMTRWQVILMVLAEAGLLGIIGGLLGLAFGLLLTRIFLASMAAMSGYDLSLVIPQRTIWTAVIVALVVSQVAAVLPALRAARTAILEAIHYE